MIHDETPPKTILDLTDEQCIEVARLVLGQIVRDVVTEYSVVRTHEGVRIVSKVPQFNDVYQVGINSKLDVWAERIFTHQVRHIFNQYKIFELFREWNIKPT